MTIVILNCFWLLTPIFIWNLLFRKRLTGIYKSEVFGNSIPKYIYLPENFFRIALFINPLFFPISFESDAQKFGFLVYAIGIVLYFVSWLPLLKENSKAYKKFISVASPAFLPLVWLIGIAFINSENNSPNIFYILLALFFTLFHLWHVIIVIKRTEGVF